MTNGKALFVMQMPVAVNSQRGSCNSSTFVIAIPIEIFMEILDPGIKLPQDNVRVKCYSSLSSSVELWVKLMCHSRSN